MNAPLLRLARPADLALLSNVEGSAASRFTEEDLPPALRGQTLDRAELQQALDDGLLWVAEDHGQVVGFLAAAEEDSSLHVLEMSVLPSHGRQGIGRGLLECAADEAARRALHGLTLTTFSHISWNGPAYRKAGFRQIEETELSPSLRRRIRDEQQQGLRHRIAMRRDVT